MQMRTFGLIVLALACLGVAYYAIATYAGGIPSGMQAGAATPEVLYVHVFASLVALALGPLQFAASLRARHPRLHRNSGRLYLLGVFVGGGAGLLLAFFAQGAWVAKAGFAALAVCWLHTAIRALVAILAGDVVAHRRWMVRNFADLRRSHAAALSARGDGIRRPVRSRLSGDRLAVLGAQPARSRGAVQQDRCQAGWPGWRSGPRPHHGRARVRNAARNAANGNLAQIIAKTVARTSPPSRAASNLR